MSVLSDKITRERDTLTLLDRVERLFLGDLELGVGPSRNLNDH